MTMKPDLSVRFAGMGLQNPVMPAAGTFEPEETCVNLVQPQKLGAVVSKTITLKKRDGNDQPRILEVPGGLINRIGLQNPGVVSFAEEKISLFAEIGVPVIVSIAGESIDEFCEIALCLERRASALISALELNVSCPNVRDGTIFGTNTRLLLDLVRSLRMEIGIDFPLIVKLTPNVDNIARIAKVAEVAGANALSLINTVKASAYIPRGPHAGQWIDGGLSGPVIKPIALRMVREVAKVVDLPLIAMGGISNTEDALEFLRIKNVQAVAVGTSSFREPLTMTRIIEGIRKYLLEKKYASIAEFKKREQV
jgi:dihydroorotate dehydrogenase (NAD+) catalytic subunit